MKIPLLALAATVALAACSDEGSLLVVEVTATMPITASTLTATVTSTMTATRTLSVPIPGGTLTTLEFGHDVGASVDEVEITLTAGDYSAATSAKLMAGIVTKALITIGPGSDMGVDLGTDMGSDAMAQSAPPVLVTSGLTGPPTAVPAWIAVDGSGTVYVRHAGDCVQQPDTIDLVKPAGGFMGNGVSGVLTSCGGGMSISGTDLYLGGSKAGTAGQESPYDTLVQQVPLTTGLTASMITSFGTSAAWTTFTAKDVSYDDLFFTAANRVLEQVTAPETTTASTSTLCDSVYYDPVGARLLCASGTAVLAATALTPPVFGPFVPTAGVEGDMYTSLTVDKRGTVYMACQRTGPTVATPCSTGAVFEFDPSSQMTYPIADSSAAVTGIAYDSSADQLVMLAASMLVRVSLPR